MSSTAVLRHAVVKMSVDTDGVTAGSKAVRREIEAIQKNFQRLEDTKKNIAAVSAELSKLESHLKLSKYLWGQGGETRQLLEKVTALRQQRNELIEVMKLERSRAANLGASQARYMGNLNSAIAQAAAHEANAPAIITAKRGAVGGGGGEIQQLSGIMGFNKSVSMLLKGGGILAGMTLLSRKVTSVADEFVRLNQSGADWRERLETITKAIPGANAALAVGSAMFGVNSPAAQNAAMMARQAKGAEQFASMREELEVLDLVNAAKGRGDSDVDIQKMMIDREAQKIIAASKDDKFLTSRQKQETETQALAVAAAKKRELDRQVDESIDEEQTKKLIEQRKKEKEELEKMTEWYEQFTEKLEELNREFEEGGFNKRRDAGIKQSEEADKAYRQQADALIDATRTPAEKLEADLATWKAMFDDGLISSDVTARLIKSQIKDKPEAVLPSLAIRGSQSAESLISRQSVSRKNTDEETLKQIIKMVETAKNSNELMRQIKDKLGGPANV